MCKEKILEILENAKDGNGAVPMRLVRKAFDKLPEPCEDTISRQMAINAIHCDITVTGKQNAELVASTIGAFVDRIKALPPVQPEIIRCADCDWWEKQEDSLQGRCALMQMYPTGAWYCGNARRRVTDE